VQPLKRKSRNKEAAAGATTITTTRTTSEVSKEYQAKFPCLDR